MPLRYYVPLAAAVIVGLSTVASKTGVPAPPIAVIATIGAALLALQVEDHKLGEFLAELMRALKGGRPAAHR